MCTLRTLILQTLSEGLPITARQMARRWGEDQVRCREWLDKFARIGLVQRRTRQPKRPGCKPSPDLYAPIRAAVAAELARGI